ncbi:MAG: excinuclease ABC subunit UvrA [Bacteroidota bacterium]|nr:excinuclease ABC subunit UvrA [Bacteroidota bacterium]
MNIKEKNEGGDEIINELEVLEVSGARVHNLKNIDVTIPRNQLVVITGLSGSGKSSLAFDTIYAEGQRRYIETFSAYARSFLGNLERPDVDKITGLSPVISIEQKTVSKNPRSTVGTITEIYDFLRLLFARASDAFSYKTGEKMIRYTEKEILNIILEQYNQQKIIILSPLVKGRKGHYRELFEQVLKQGFIKVRVDGEIVDIIPRLQVDRYKIHDIEIVVDRIVANEESTKRIMESLSVALKKGKGTLMIMDVDTGKVRHFSRHLMCPTTGIAYDEPAPNIFSFNSPYGACEKCNGMGEVSQVDTKKIIPNSKLSIKKGGLAPIGEYKNNWIFSQLEAILEKYGYSLSDPIENIDEHTLNTILFGTDEVIKVKSHSGISGSSFTLTFEGIINFISRLNQENPTASINRWSSEFMNTVSCPVCQGSRLKIESLSFKIDGKNIADLSSMDIIQLQTWFNDVESRLDDRKNIIAKEVLKEIRSRIDFLLDVGLTYLTLNRSAKTLSGGEAQRIRLATQIGSQLVNVLYILDEPSIGLHQRDNMRLIKALQNLRDIGNSVIVVEHDKEMIMNADYVLDIGPLAGINGGRVVASGKPQDLAKFNTLTTQYLNGTRNIEIPSERRKGSGKSLTIKGAKGHNLKNVTVEFPLGKFICVTGVSGSGKSSLINGTLYPILNQYFYRSLQKPLEYDSIIGLENVDKVIEIDQSPIGRTPRSNPATYTGVFTEIRNLFTSIPESKIRGYKPGRFSFNVKGGRCETCKGAGLKTIEMNFLPDVYVVCETCQGKRYNRETLEIRYKGKSISDVLEMTIDQAVDFFKNIPFILIKIKAIKEVGLGYITLGQQSTTLSGGEAQRVKLATELSKRDTGNTFYILDEPTTGLHFEDIKILLEVLNKLADNGNTILVIEHNMDIIKVADYIIDLGPEGGNAGGNIVCTGTPEEIVSNNKSITGEYLKLELIENKI